MRYDQTQIERARKQKGWSQTELAAKAGVTSACISQIERGIRQNPETFGMLAKILGIPMKDLVVEDGEQKTA